MCNQESQNTTEHKIMLKVKLPDGETEGSDGDVVNMEYSEVWEGLLCSAQAEVGSNASGISEIF